MTLKIILLGAKGQLGQTLALDLKSSGKVQSFSHGDGSGSIDFFNPQQMRRVLEAEAPEVIVNAAAYTNVDRAESEVDQAFMVNAEAPRLLAESAKQMGSLLIHYSSDYVFDGSGSTPWREEDAARPLNAYGRSKLAGEQAVTQSGCRHFIFRTSWVYGSAGKNFLKTILSLSASKETLTVINDQIGAPTSVGLLSAITTQAIAAMSANTIPYGLYHVAPQGFTSWYGYAETLLAEARKHGAHLALQQLLPVAAQDYPTAAQRPLNSRLNTDKLQQHFAITLPPWQQDVVATIKILTADKPGTAC